MTVDAIDYAVISQSIVAAAREMGAKLVRSAYSTVLREARDGSAAILDRNGGTVAQAELIPIQLGSIGMIYQACAEVYPVDELQPGDFYVINDPYSGGQHLQDVFIFHPIFFEGEVVGFSASVAHHLDIGGGSPGLSVQARDVHAEGLILPPLRLNMERDWNGGAFYRLIRANVRIPHQTMGDFEAQMAANEVGARRVQELCAKYGPDQVQTVMAAFQNYAERRTRAGIIAAPDGVYHGEDWIDDDGINEEPLAIKVKLIIDGDRIDVDFSGTSPQVVTNLNSTWSATVSSALCCIKSVLTSSDIPFNAGAARPVTVTAPDGCILKPTYPAPVRARLEPCYRVFNAVMKALAQAVPEKVIACGFDTATIGCLSYLGPKGYSVYLEIFGGGFGAAEDQDGCNAVDCPLSNCANTPVEAIEQDFEFFRMHEYAIVPESYGHGAQRGGAGFRRAYRILRDGARVALYGDRFRRGAGGLFGGLDGQPGSCRILRGEEIIHLKSKDEAELLAGDIVEFSMGGGAGYGAVEDRMPALVTEDVADGLISIETARRIYDWEPDMATA